jgi:hypothetical protein
VGVNDIMPGPIAALALDPHEFGNVHRDPRRMTRTAPRHNP